jgi:vacuolar-type H+-ATPase subunit I/STV1
MQPIFRGTLAPTAPVLGLFFVFAVTQRISAHPRIQAILASLNWLLLIFFIASFAMQLGGANT